MRCDAIPESVDTSWGSFTTQNNYSDSTYSFYSSADDTHFTVTGTNGGSGDFKKFHLTMGSFNAHIWFDEGYPAPDKPWDNDRNFGQNLPSAEWEEFRDYAEENWDSICAVALEFWNNAQAG